MAISNEAPATEKRETQGFRARVEPKRVRYGLPCADCRAYYPADLKACPVCNSVERVPPQAAAVYARIQVSQATR